MNKVGNKRIKSETKKRSRLREGPATSKEFGFELYSRRTANGSIFERPPSPAILLDNRNPTYYQRSEDFAQ